MANDAAAASSAAAAAAPAAAAAAAPAAASTVQAAAQSATSGQSTQAAADERYGAPEAYDAKGSETFTEKLRGDLHLFGKDFNLSQKGVGRMYDIANAHAKSQTQAIEASHTANMKEWATQSAADKEFGGEQYNANKAVAEKGLETFATPELREILKGSGLDNHPEFFRLFFRVGKAVSEDKFVRGGGGANSNQAGSMFSYPNSQHG